jgi:acetyl-CoA acyltransferase
MRNVYVVSAVRTAIGKARRTLALENPVRMGTAVVKEALARAGISGEAIEDIVIGCAFPEGEQGMNPARIIGIAAGLPDSVPAETVNRFCSSGLEAMHVAAAKIRCGYFDVAITGGVESMSMIPMTGVKFAPEPNVTNEHPEVYISMGNCGDNVAREFHITRQQCDEWALRSNMRAIQAIDTGKFKSQIVPLEIETAKGKIIFDTDEGPRRDTTPEGLAALKPAFAGPGKKGGVCTAGNSSQMSDGASAVCLMSEDAVKKYGVKPLAKVLGYRVCAGSPKYLGPAQIEAIPKACALSGIKIEEIGLFENNEAFAPQCLLVMRELKLDPEKVNLNGGAIALGHPLGCTGAKLSTQVIYEMQARGVKYGMVTMCIGGGMGAAGVFELCN